MPLQLRINFDTAHIQRQENCLACHSATRCMGCCLSCKRLDDCGNPHFCDEFRPESLSDRSAVAYKMQLIEAHPDLAEVIMKL